MAHHISRAAVAVAAVCAGNSPVLAQTTVLEDVVVTAPRPVPLPTASRGPTPGEVTAQAAASSDAARLLATVPGVALAGAGGVSSLPVIHGLADDRNRIRVDGMDLISACANHMNPPLSYIDPTNVGRIQVFSGVTPVSAGGDSLGGTIIVDSQGPRFADPGAGLWTHATLGTFYRSNGDGHGFNATAELASEQLSVTYRGATAEAKNYKAAKDFKPGALATWTTRGSHWIGGDVVGSSGYKTENHALGFALRNGDHLLDLKVGFQHIPEQGFPNQHMDMTDNRSTQINLGYTGKFTWGALQARVYHEQTRHQMDFAGDKLYWYGATHNVAGMPMDTRGNNTGVAVKAEVTLSERDLVRLGSEYQRYRLDDWWAPVANSMMMSPNTFWNINNGQRDRLDLYGEWEAQWTPRWLTLAGVRGSLVKMDAGTVQGYNTVAMMYGNDAARFNASNRRRNDDNLDLSALARFTPDAGQAYAGGYSRKTRSPSLYERYTWSTNGMAMTMNNWVNDGNGYVGDVNLKPEVAHTLSVTADWHDATGTVWGLSATPYYSRVDDYIDARCLTTCTARQFNTLKLINRDARLFGVDFAAFFPIARSTSLGHFTGRGVVSYVDGQTRGGSDHLYNIMPLNARLAVEHRLGNWTNTVESHLVSAKTRVSQVRNEMKTPGYGLLNLRSSYEHKQFRVDIGLENALNKQYSLPLGGAYIGQGATMSLNGAGAPYGLPVPGMGRSLYAGVSVKF